MYNIYTCIHNQQATSLGRCETEGVWLARLMNHCHLSFKKAGLDVTCMHTQTIVTASYLHSSKFRSFGCQEQVESIAKQSLTGRLPPLHLPQSLLKGLAVDVGLQELVEEIHLETIRLALCTKVWCPLSKLHCLLVNIWGNLNLSQLLTRANLHPPNGIHTFIS